MHDDVHLCHLRAATATSCLQDSLSTTCSRRTLLTCVLTSHRQTTAEGFGHSSSPVADEAGVAVMTISNVMHGKPERVSHQTYVKR